MVSTRLRTCLVCRVGLLVGHSIAFAIDATVEKSSSIPSRYKKSNMLALLAIVSISFKRLSDGVCCGVGRKISLLARRVACLHILVVALKSVSGRLFPADGG